MNTVDIFIIIALLAASALCIYLIVYLKNVTKSIQEIKSDLNELTAQIKPLITSTTNLSEKLNFLSEEAKGQVNIVKTVISEVKDRVETILAFEEKVRRGLEEPVLGLIKNLSAISHGVNAFWKTYKKT